MNILNLFEAVYISHVLSLVKKGLECIPVGAFQFPNTMRSKDTKP
jgi:hypothetical protein